MINWDNTGVTVELGDIVASGVDVWAFEYPVPAQTVTYNGKTAPVPFDKKAFEQKILDHYRFRQIGQETVGRWLHYFRTRIREIMPYYVQLYEFEAKWFNVDDPLESYNLVETFQQETHGSGTVTGSNSSENTGTTSSTSSGTTSTESSGNTSTESAGTTSEEAEKVTKFSDTPQGSIENLDNYLTTATQENSNGSGTTSGNTSSSSTEESSGTSSEERTDTSTGSTSGTSEQASEDSGTTTHTLTRRGNIGVQPLGTEVNNIREAFINIDLMVINELKDLFLQVY